METRITGPSGDYPASPAEFTAHDAATRISRILEAADGRELTKSQERDLAEARAAVASVAGDSFDDNLYARQMAEQLVTLARSTEPRPELEALLADDLAKNLAFVAMRRAKDPFGQRGVVEYSAGSNAGDLRALGDGFARARDGGFSAFESRITPSLFETRALQSAGGSAIPTSFADFVTVYERTFTPMLDPGIVTILGNDTGAPIVLPRLTADVNHGGTITAEAAGINELDPTFSSVTLNPYKYGVINLWSAELDTDNVIGLRDLMARSTGRELGIDIGSALTTGDGSGKPQGFIGVATNGGTAAGTASWGASATFFGWGDLVSLYGSVASPYRSNGTWMVSSDAFTKILQFRDTNNQPILIPGLGGAPATILGRPVVENPAMAAVGSASKSVAFGDFSRYVVVRVNPTRVELSRDYKFSTDQIALRTIERVDGDLIDTAAVAYLVSANT